MKNFFTTILVFILFIHTLSAQLANWSAFYPNKFPTNQSGQIHGEARISQLKFHPSNPNKYYAVTSQGGLFTSLDGGNNWTVSAGTDVLPINAASICIDYTDDQTLYFGGGDANYYNNGSGIFKSINGGASFTQLTGLPTKLVIDIIMHPTDHNTLVAVTDGGIYKTTDAGAHWTAKTATNISFCDLKQATDPNSQTLFACTSDFTNLNSKFYRSTDFGDTWVLIAAGLSAPNIAPLKAGGRIGVTPADPNVVYYALVSSGGTIYKSTDGGLNFSLMKDGGSPYLSFYNDAVNSSGQGNYNFAIGVDRVDPTKIWLQSHNTWFSSNSGTTWTMLTFWSQKVHTDMHQISQSPYNASKLYSCNDGGVWLSTDGGTNWTPKSDGIYAYEIGNNAGKGSPTRRDFINIGTQDNGELYADSTGWYTIRGGDWYSLNEIDYRPNSTMMYYGNNAKRRSLADLSQSALAFPTGTISFSAMAFNRTNTSLSFAGLSDTLMRSTTILTTTPTWTQLTKLSGSIKSIHSCIADANRLYIITSDDKFYVSSDALSATPTFTSYNLPSSASSIGTVTAICNNANIVYISVNNKVYRSGDGGQNWTNVTYTNLPNVNHRRIISENYDGSQELVFIATNNAVYYKKAGQTSWTNYSTNLPSRKSPTELSIFDDGTNNALIRYSCFGRGVWQTPIGNLRPLQAYISTNKPSDICAGNVFTFNNASNGNYTSVQWSFPNGTPSTSTSNNPVVTYPTVGTYTATLTVTDATNATSTTNINVTISRINYCSVDTTAGTALSTIANGDDFVKMGANLKNITNFTTTAWIKPNGAQDGFAGIISNGEWCAHCADSTNGLIFDYNGTKLWYRWAGISDNWASNSGMTIPLNQWSYVAMVIKPDTVFLYLNDQMYVHAYTSTDNKPKPANITNLYMGLGHYSKYYRGQIDEVSLWNRALTQNEIRELRHLTKENKIGTDPNLIGYFQFNDSLLATNNLIIDKAKNYNGYLQGNAALTTSTAPIGSGTCQRQNANGTMQTLPFALCHLNLLFPTSGVFPNGELVVSELSVSPDQNLTNGSPLNKKYWIIDNYGTNQTFTPLTGINFGNLGNFATGNASNFKLYKRSSNADGATWGTTIDGADALTSTNNNTLTFTPASPCVGITSSGQFTITNDPTATLPTPCLPKTTPTQSMSFTGVSASNAQSIANAPNWGTAKNFTISFWCRSANTATYASILSDKDWYTGYNKGFVFAFQTNYIKFNIGDGTHRIDLVSQTGLNDNQWHHVAASVTRTGTAILYIDGINVASNSATALTDITSGYKLTLGSDAVNNYPYTGQIDEVRIWEGALTQDQLRENMHLTSLVGEANLINYFQFNDANSTETDLGNQINNLNIGANATRIASTAPVGGGNSLRMTVNSGGVKDFSPTNCLIEFPTSGTYPNGEIVVSQLNVTPDQSPTTGTILPNKYWIIRNFGTNATFTALPSLQFNNIANISSATNSPSAFSLFKRASNAFGSTWGTKIADAAQVTANNDGSGNIKFSTGLNNTSFSQFVISATEIQLSMKVFLQGPYNIANGTMDANLRSLASFPTTTPYGGSETINASILSVSGNDAIVDWIKIELRDKNNPATILQTRSALLQSDGDIVETDGISPVIFAGLVTDNYFIAIKHRNHLGFRTTNPISLSASGSNAINFTDNLTSIYNTTVGVNPLSSVGNVYMMWSGDGDGSGTIDASDRSSAWNDRNLTGYQISDFSMNGTVDATDRSVAWNNRNKIAFY